MINIVSIEQDGEALEMVRKLFTDYSKELGEDLCFQSFDEELKNPLKKYVDSGGCILLAYVGNDPSGCIALLSLQEAGVCEMKRLYVSPEYRKNNIAKKLVEELLTIAVAKGFNKMVLDTLQRLQPAISLYKKFGFTTTNAYYENPIEDVVYMQKKLNQNI